MKHSPQVFTGKIAAGSGERAEPCPESSLLATTRSGGQRRDAWSHDVASWKPSLRAPRGRLVSATKGTARIL